MVIRLAFGDPGFVLICWAALFSRQKAAEATAVQAAN
jgi:hypothetical protein